MNVTSFTVSGWSDAADLVAVVSFPAVVAAVVIGAWQIITQLHGSRREAAFEVYLQFTDRFAESLDLRSSIRSRFASKDATLDDNCVKQFYNNYWHIQINEWEMFRAGLLPSEIYSTWLCYTHDSMVGDFDMPYYQAGSPSFMTGKEAFRFIALSQMMRSNKQCREFFIALKDIPFPAMRDRQVDSSLDQRLEDRRIHIVGLLNKFRREYRRSRSWKLA